MSGIPGFSSPLARQLISLAVWVENRKRRRDQMPAIEPGALVRLSVHDGALLRVRGKIGDADARLGFGPATIPD